MIQFGQVPPGAIDRPGAYAVVLLPNGQVAMVRTPVGVYLPGGGIDPGESPEDALHREMAEETGLLIDIVARIGVVRQVVPRHGRPAWNKVCHYFRCTERGTTRQLEEDHELLWVPLDRAAQHVPLPADRWALGRLTE